MEGVLPIGSAPRSDLSLMKVFTHLVKPKRVALAQRITKELLGDMLKPLGISQDPSDALSFGREFINFHQLSMIFNDFRGRLVFKRLISWLQRRLSHRRRT